MGLIRLSPTGAQPAIWTESQDAMGQQRGAYIHRCIDQLDGAPS